MMITADSRLNWGRVILPLFVLVLSSCASMNKQECLDANWSLIGYQDGAAGFEQNRLAVHSYACERHSISPIPEAYHRGYQRGLIDFCVPASGFQLGSTAADYHYACPDDAEPSFLTAYIDGLSRRLAKLDWHYRDLEFELDSSRFRYHSVSNDNESSNQSERLAKLNRRAAVLDNKLDNLRFERIRVRSLLTRARRHL